MLQPRFPNPVDDPEVQHLFGMLSLLPNGDPDHPEYEEAFWTSYAAEVGEWDADYYGEKLGYIARISDHDFIESDDIATIAAHALMFFAVTTNDALCTMLDAVLNGDPPRPGTVGRAWAADVTATAIRVHARYHPRR